MIVVMSQTEKSFTDAQPLEQEIAVSVRGVSKNEGQTEALKNMWLDFPLA